MSRLGLVASSFTLAAALTVSCGDGEPAPLCGGEKIRLNNQCLEDTSIAVNSVGVLPDRPKIAVYEAESGEFEVVDASSGKVVFSGVGAGPEVVVDDPAAPSVYVADFTELKEEGQYFVRAGGRVSGDFTIGLNALGPALNTAMLGLYGQRCGVNVEFEHGEHTYRHAACHLEEAYVTWPQKDATSTADDTGGWHDAGDYGKYVRNGAYAVAYLLAAYEAFPELLKDWEFELPEAGGSTPDILDEARVELEWILKTQFDDGSFAHKVTAERFEGFVMPSDDSQERFFFSTSTHSTGNAVAVLAQSSRIFEAFDADFAEACLKASELGQDFLDAHPEEIFSEQLEGGTGEYGSGGDRDERAWALVELWETTGDGRYLEGFEAVASDASFTFGYTTDWANTENLAIATYLLSDRNERDPATVERLTRDVVTRADQLAKASRDDAYGRGFDSYYWGSAGVTARMTSTLVLAHKIYPNEAYLDGITSRVDYLLGRNPFARSLVTGLGTNPPVSPHHRPSAADSVSLAWPGLLIGGPNGGPLEWVDTQESFTTNEIAINWNTALVYALVAAQGTVGDESADCVPNCLGDGSDSGLGGSSGLGGTGQ